MAKALLVLFVAILFAFSLGDDKEIIKKGKEIFKPLRDNPTGTITKEQMRAMLLTLFDSTWTKIESRMSADDPGYLREGARKMFETYADTLPETMTTTEFLKIIQGGDFVGKLMEIAEKISQKTDL